MSSQNQYNIVIVGVGGQGTLLASRILGQLAIASGDDVKVSEVHGMSQRGGSVITYVRVGNEIASPIVAEGEADYLLSFEPLEAARAAGYLRRNGVVITNTQRISPMPVITGTVKYPENPLDKLSSFTVRKIDALKIANECGNGKAVNLVLIGALSRYLSYSEQEWEQAITQCVPPKFLEINLKAFRRGREE